MGDVAIRSLERAARNAPPGSPERQAWLCALHRTGVDPLPLEPGDLVEIVHYYADRKEALRDGTKGWFEEFDHRLTDDSDISRANEPLVRVDYYSTAPNGDRWSVHLSASWIRPLHPDEDPPAAIQADD